MPFGRVMLWVLACSVVSGSAAARPAPRGVSAAAIVEAGARHIASDSVRAAIQCVSTEAMVAYRERFFETTIVSARDGRMAFEQHEGFRAGVDSMGPWGWDEEGFTRTPLDSLEESAVRGHELQWLVMAPTTRWRATGVVRDTVFRSQRAFATWFVDALGAPAALFHARRDTLPLGLLIRNHTGRGEPRIEVELLEWKPRDGQRWFMRADFHQGAEVFEHRYRSIEVVTPHAQWFEPDRNGALVAGHMEVLLGLHAKVMGAHRDGNVDAILADEGDEYVVAGRGEVTHPTLEQRRARLGPYLRRTRFEVYEDMIPPAVEVSPEGKLGWVVVQVHARGEQTGDDGKRQPVEFTSAWIELYRNVGGNWRRIGNVSNFMP